MKLLHTLLLPLSLTLLLAACQDPSPPSAGGGTGGPGPSTPATAQLKLTLNGVPSAPVKIVNAAGEVKFDGTASSGKLIDALPYGKYTVTAGEVPDAAAPAAQVLEVNSATVTLTLTYTALPGRALLPGHIRGTFSEAAARNSVAQVSMYKGTIATSPVDQNGKLDVTLPDEGDLKLYPLLAGVDNGCTYVGSGRNSPGLISDFATVELYTPAGDDLGPVREVAVGGSAAAPIYQIYATAPQSYVGTLTCQSGPAITLNLKFQTGWNATSIEPRADGSVSISSVPFTTRTQLTLDKLPPAVQLSLSQSVFTLKPGESTTVTATLASIGGLSGAVDLSTDVPGVTVEPASVTLPAPAAQNMTAQSMTAHSASAPGLHRLMQQAATLKAQSVKTTLTLKAAADAEAYSGPMTLLAKQDGKLVGQAPATLQLQVPSVTGYLNYGGGVSLDRGQTLSVPVNLYSTNGYTGSVTVSLENLPDGVSASTVQTDTSASTSPSISITASATAVPGTKEATLVVNAGGRLTRNPVNITVQKPVIWVNTDSSTLIIRRGQTQNLNVQISGQHGFSGSTTISLSGLPSGVTAAPLTVNVAAGAVTNAVLPVSASESAVYGTAQVQLTGPDLGSQMGLSVSVATSITAVLDESVRIATAGSGLWTLSTNGRYAPGNVYGLTYTLKRYENNQIKLNTTLFVDGGASSSLLTTPGGALVIFGDSKIYTVQADGTISSVTGDTSAKQYPKVIDAQNRLWYAGAGQSATLNTLNLVTGAQTLVNGIAVSDTYFQMYRNTAGTALYLAANYSNNFTLTQIDTASSAKIKDIPLPGISSVNSLTISNDGSIWGAGSYSSVFKANNDGTLTVFSSLPPMSKLAYDVLDAKTIWGYNGSNVYKIDVSTGTANSFMVGYLNDIAVDAAGGVWAVVNDNAYWANPHNYLSLVK